MEEQPPPGEGLPGGEDGTAAVLYGILTTFSEALGQFDERLTAIERALREGPTDLLARTERLEAAMDRLVVAVEGRQAGLDVLLDTLRSLAGRVESMGVRMELAREGVEEVVQAAGWLPEAVESFRSLESTVAERAAALAPEGLTELAEVVRGIEAGVGERDTAVAARVEELAGLVRHRTEAVEQRLTAVSSEVAAVRGLLQAHVDDVAHSLGRRATDAGRRLAADLGLRGRPKPPTPGGPPAAGNPRG